MAQCKVIESDAHQILGDVKIQEICQRYFPENKIFLKKIKNIVDRILLTKNSKSVSVIFNQEAGYWPELRVKTKIKRIIKDIYQLLAFGRK